MDRLSSARISTTAREYLEAACIVARSKKEHFQPVYFLFGQAIELSLKSYLRAKGYSKQALLALSHDIAKCLVRAREEGLDELLKSTDSDRKLVSDLNRHYRSKDLQYTEVGLKSTYPEIDHVEAFANKLFRSISPVADQSLKAHYGKPTAVV